MGSGFGITHWTNKDSYATANNFQDDVAIITSNLGVREDVVPDSPQANFKLTVIDSIISQRGIIEDSTDIDSYSFQIGVRDPNSSTYMGERSAVEFFVDPLDYGYNLDVAVEVLDENLRPLTVTQIEQRFAAGTYADIVREVKLSRVELPDHN